jgi:hypothetical protein
MKAERTHQPHKPQPRKPQPRRTRWQEYVVSKAYYLDNERNRLCDRACQDTPTTSYLKAATSRHLAAARRAAGVEEDGQTPIRFARRDLLVNAWTGASVEGAFVNLHAAEVVLANLYDEQDIDSRVPDVLARMRTCMAADDERRIKAEMLFGEQANGRPPSPTGRQWRRNGRSNGHHPTQGRFARRGANGGGPDELARRRAGLRDAMRVSYDAADELHTRVRSFRNVLIVSAVVLSMLVLAVCAVGIRWPKAIPLCFQPSFTASGAPPQPITVEQISSFACPSSTGRAMPRSGDVPIVALMGLLGGALSATFGIQKLRGTSTPYAIPVALSSMKLPAGALTAIVGLVLVHGEFVPGLSELDSQGQILAYAVVLGVAQHLFTRFVDRRAETVLNSLPSKDGPTPTGERPAQATEGKETPEIVHA